MTYVPSCIVAACRDKPYSGLLAALGNTLPPPTYMKILSKEKEITKLLQAVQQNPSYVFDHGKQLSKEFPQEVCAMCVSKIYRQAERADKRPRYKGVCSSIKKLFEFGGIFEAEDIIIELKEKYPRRTAFIDELTKQFGKKTRLANSRGRYM